MDISQQDLESLVQRALEEDVGAADLTTQATIPPHCSGRAAIMARAEGVLAGLEVARLVFQRLDPEIRLEADQADGDRISPGQVLARLEGSLQAILTGERTALNFLQRLSGIATLTARYVAALAGLPVQILDTRKTTPGWRRLEKYAVRMGGGHNHRFGLYDMVLIKDNHIAAAGGIVAAVRSCQEYLARVARPVAIEVEVDTLAQLAEVLPLDVDWILLDNMAPEQLREAVAMAEQNARQHGRLRVKLEASGGITLETVRAIAATGVDCVSVGALTHSAAALDIGLDLEPTPYD